MNGNKNIESNLNLLIFNVGFRKIYSFKYKYIKLNLQLYLNRNYKKNHTYSVPYIWIQSKKKKEDFQSHIVFLIEKYIDINGYTMIF